MKADQFVQSPMLFAACVLLAGSATAAGAAPAVKFAQSSGQVVITVGEAPVATYVYADNEITRPYFAHVHAPNGVQVTRNHPPKKDDSQDHADLHPGIWLALGDLSSHDSWRLKAKVVGGDLVEPPEGGPGRGSFTVRNRYLSTDGDKTICTETCRYTILVRPAGHYLLISDSTFQSDAGEFDFGDDMDEMGLGVRLATPIAVASGKGGEIVNSEGRRNEKQVRARLAEWCDYRGTVDGKQIGIAVMAAPSNSRRTWWHARDYGFMAANAFKDHADRPHHGRIVIKPGESFRLVYGIAMHGAARETPFDPQAAYADFVKVLGTSPSDDKIREPR